MSEKYSIISPVDGSTVAERTLSDDKELQRILEKSNRVQRNWANLELSEKKQICHKAIDILVNQSEVLTREITWQMGRPISYTPGEIRGLEERARYMIDIAEQALADSVIEDNNSKRFIRRTPLGLVLTIAPWNYPYLTAINSIIPALMAGNTVLLKHSTQTLLCAEQLTEAFRQAGLADGVFQYVHINHETTGKLVQNNAVNFISFTGSTRGGIEIEQATSGLFKGLALELGGKDPAYVSEGVNLEYAVKNIVDGAFFNSGQSCCAVERIYVHEKIYDKFVEQFIQQVSLYRLGNPLDTQTTLGPMVNVGAANRVRLQIEQAVKDGAKTCIDPLLFSADKGNTAYLAPQVLLNVNHKMAVMSEESFGPVVGIMKVKDDKEAINLMNDSVYGLTASIWSDNLTLAEAIGAEVNTGTVFMNRCDYLDPALAWNGIKQSGRGVTLSALGYQQLTRPKSFHLKSKLI